MEPYEEDDQQTTWVGAALFVAALTLVATAICAFAGFEAEVYIATFLAGLVYRVAIL